MKDAVTIVVVYVTRQHDQSLLNISQDLGLEAATNFLQRVDEARQFVGRYPPVQGKPIQPRHLSPHPDKRVQRHLVAG
jgi:hypothetical protein